MRKGSKKRTTIVLVLLFLIGALMFIWPMVSEVTSYEADDEEYPDACLPYVGRRRKDQFWHLRLQSGRIQLQSHIHRDEDHRMCLESS